MLIACEKVPIIDKIIDNLNISQGEISVSEGNYKQKLSKSLYSKSFNIKRFRI